MLRTKGFTLIELLIVVAIIGILAAIAIPNFLNAQVRAKVASVKAEMSTIVTGLESYYVDNNAYVFPSYGHATNGGCNSTFDMTNKAMSLDSMTRNQGLTTPVAYLSTMPRDIFSKNKAHWYGYMGWRNKWILTSYGPDTDSPPTWNEGDIEEVCHFPPNIYKPEELEQRAYNPTNGTVSNGDLYRTSYGSMK